MNHVSSRLFRKTILLNALLLQAFSWGCGGQVDLGGGGPPQALPPEPAQNGAEVAAGTVGLARFAADFVTGLAADGTNLYLLDHVYLDQVYPSSYVHRCQAADCWSTWTLLHSFAGDATDFELQGNRLGWANKSQGLQLCRVPECGNIEIANGVAIEVTSLDTVTWDDDFVYFYLYSDSSIYRCSLADCHSTLTLLTDGVVSAHKIVVSDEFLYMLASGNILRLAKDGSSAPDQLALEGPTAWEPLPGDTLASPNRIAGFAVDGPWIYAVLGKELVSCAGLGCYESAQLVRWRHSAPGAARELLATYVAPPDSSLWSLDGELVWVSADDIQWSCLADDCAATTRQLGSIGIFGRGGYVAGDADYIYWLSTACPDTGCPQMANWNLKRTPRIAPIQ